jgi:tetratricopeptide (TPR) repeat protein
VIAGQALRLWGRYAQAREQLTAAVAVLRDDPDTDTVRALGELARLEVHAGSPAADALSAEALALGQNLAVDAATLAGLFETRGIHLNHAGLRPQAASYFREAARLAGQAGDPVRLGRALLNLSDTVNGTDPAAGVEAARAAAAQLRRVGARDYLAVAVGNLAADPALIMTVPARRR